LLYEGERVRGKGGMKKEEERKKRKFFSGSTFKYASNNTKPPNISRVTSNLYSHLGSNVNLYAIFIQVII